MRLAYADPPYPGRAELYAGHPDYAGEVDHRELIDHLDATYDGWALSTSSRSLRDVIAMCPPGVRVLVWLNTNVGRSWEPVLVMPARPLPNIARPLDWIKTDVESFQWRPKPAGYVIGRKPPAFCRWVFVHLGARARSGDSLDDLFPGSGAVGEAWAAWNDQPTLPRPVSNRDARKWRTKKPGWLSIDDLL